MPNSRGFNIISSKSTHEHKRGCCTGIGSIIGHREGMDRLATNLVAIGSVLLFDFMIGLGLAS